MQDGRRLRRAVVSATTALSACAALALPALPAAAARTATSPPHPSVKSAPRVPATAASPPAQAAPKPAARTRSRPAPAKPKPPGRRIQGDIVPGHAPAIRHDAARRTHVTKVLVILGYWHGHDSTTPAKAKQLVITEPNTWYRHASYGRQGLSGTATKWLKIPQQKCGALNDAVIKAAKKAADKAHYHPSRYDRIVLYEPCKANGFIGVGNLPGRNVVLVKGGLNLATAVHEQGHNYGLGHANQLICTRHGARATYQPGAACKTQVYDDFSSAMSSQWNGKYAGDFTAPEKDELGWLTGHVKTVSGAGTVTLNPYESTSGTHAIKIPGASGRTYWLEYRTTRGNDAHLPKAYRGVLIHMSKPGGGGARLNQSLLLHTLAPDPNILGFQATAGLAYLPQLSSWTTPDGIRITVTAESSGAATITIARNAHAQSPGAVTALAATALDGSATVSFHRASDGGTPIRNYTITATPSGPHTTITDYTGHSTLDATVNGLTNGQTYTLTVRATSESGNGPNANTGQLQPQVRPPTAVIDSPTGGDVQDVVNVVAHGVRNPVTNAKITELELVVDGHLIDDVAASSHTFQWDTGDAPGFAQDADHTIKVTATDANGRTSSSTVSVHLTHSTGPNLELTNITQIDNSPPSVGAVDINGSATHHNHNPASVVVTVAGPKGTIELGEITNPADLNPFAIEWDTRSADFANGNHTVTITATDTAGKVSVITKTVPLNNPGISFQDPTGSVFGNVHFTGTVTNSSPVDDVTVEVDRGGTAVQSATIVNVASGDTAPFDIVVNVDNLDAGNSPGFTVKATDGTTRNAAPNPRALNVVRKNPDVTLSTPTASSVVHDLVHFTGSVTNNSGTDGLNIVVDQASNHIVTSTALDIDAGATGNFDVSGNVGGLSDATASFTVTVTDNKSPKGLTAMARSLVVSHLPEITLPTPGNNATVFGAAHFSGTLKNHSATANLTVAVSSDAGPVSPASQIVTVPAHSSATNFDIVVDVDDVGAGADQMFTVTVTDHDGLVKTLNRELQVTHPDPDLTVTAPVAGTVVHDSTHFTGSVTNNSGTDGLTLTIEVDDSAFITSDLDVAAGATAPFDVSGNVGTFNVGSRAFVTTVTDANDRTNQDSRQLKVDHPPVVNITAPIDNAIVSGTVAVTGTLTLGSPTAGDTSIAVKVDGVAKASGTTSNSNFSVNLDTSALTVGSRTVTVTATDAAGVSSTSAATVNVRVDHPPVVTIGSPTANATVNGTIAVSGTVTTGGSPVAGATTVDVAVDGVATALDSTSNGNYSADVDTSTLTVGTHAITVTATDAAGVSSVSGAAVSVKVDHPPVVTVTAPTANANVSGIVTVTGTVSNGAPAAGNPTVTASVDATHHASDTPTVAQGATGNYSIDLDLSDLTGSKTITVTATDASGVTTTTPVTVHVTVVAPAGLTVTAPAGGETVTTGSLHFAGTVTNHAATTQSMTIHITDGDTIDQSFQVSVPTGPATNWNHDIDVSALDDAPDTFTVTATYSFGGTSTAIQRTVTIDNP